MPDPAFTLLDVPFQIGTGQLRPTTLLRTRAHRLDLTRAALIITPSKDLSLPGLRAAVLVTRSPALTRHLGGDRFERMALTTSPLAEAVMIFYISLLNVLEAPRARTDELVHALHTRMRRAGLPPPPGPDAYERIRHHLNALRARIRRNTRTIAAPG
ncbi:hypothetical protein [Streptomyces sp. NPDC059816]|uniref:hypothetical protein n=1 Tax=Streptomyces sp. NPDC059816 TaxID=3346960 RepID=UPI0036656CF0